MLARAGALSIVVVASLEACGSFTGTGTEGPDASVDANAGDAGTDVPRVDAALDAQTWSNGHAYAVVVRPGLINWSQADTEAKLAGGHLVTLTTAEENDFVASLVVGRDDVWDDKGNGPWMGALQPPGSTEPGGGWQWVTGEPWNFAAWNPGEPNNNAGTEDKGEFYDHKASWNDQQGDFGSKGYVIEFE